MSPMLNARLMQYWSYQEMFNKADLVVIAAIASSKDTDERTILPNYSPPLKVVGVVSEFESRLVLKGDKKIAGFQLHYYRYQFAQDEDAVANTPELVRIKPGQKAIFLLFLIKESDGRYAPVTGQTDPSLFSVLELKGGAD